MENDTNPTPADDAAAASALLGDLDSDRASFARRLEAPSWLAPAFGILAAAYVAAPAAGEARSGSLLVLIILSVVLIHLYRRATGIRVSRIGLPEWLLCGAALLVCLVLLSVSLGLVSFGLNWWVILPAAVAFLVGSVAASRFIRSAQERIRNAR